MESNLDTFLSGSTEPAEVQEQEPQAPEPQAEAVPTGEDAATPAEQPQDDPFEKHRKGLEAAAVAERGKRHAAEARAQALEAQLQQYLATQQQPQAQEGAPDPNDPRFQDNPQEYWRLLARHEAREVQREREERDRVGREEQEKQRAKQAFDERVNAVVSQGEAKYSDFTTVVNAGLGPFLNQTLTTAIAMSSNGDDVAYWLGKNPAEAARISQLHPMLAVMEIGKLSTKATVPAQQPIPRTLTTSRDTRGQFASSAYQGPTPIDAIFGSK